MKKLPVVLSFVIAAFSLSSCADFFQGKVPMDTSKEDLSSLYDLLTPPVKITSLDAPSELYASRGLYAGKVSVSWSAVENATSYQLERAVVKEPSPDGTWKLPDESEFEVINSFVYGTTYTDVILQNPLYSSLEPDYRYYYRVMAQNIIKGYDSSPYYPDYEVHKEKDENGNVINEYVPANPEIFGCLFKAPSQVEADKGKSSDSISLTWNPVSGAAKYLIYRGEKENGTDSVYIDEVFGSETSYTNTVLPSEQGVEFYYKIYAQNANGERSPASSLAMGYSLVEGAPVAPEKVYVDNGLGTSSSSITVKWDEVTGAGNISYALYRTSSIDSSYRLLKKGLTVREFKDSTAASGLYYYYFVQVSSEQDGTVLKSAFSDSGKTSDFPALGFLLSPPSSVEVCDSSKGSSYVCVRWKPAINVPDEKAQIDYSYNIRVDSSADGYFGDVAVSETKGELDSDGFLFCDIPVTSGWDYFAVTTVNADGTDKESKKSTVVAPVPDAPEKVYATKTAGRETFKKLIEEKGGAFDESEWSPNKNEVYPILVTWSASEKAAGYDIYRSTKPESGFKKINDFAVTGLYYLDAYSAAKSGTFYYYKVYPLNTLGQGTKSNDPENDVEHNARGYGALTREQWFREYNKTVKSSQSKLTLMHKASDLDKVGSETISGDISGSLSYKAAVVGLGAEITMHYENFADKFISDDSALGIKFVLQGNTDTTSNMSANGHMHEAVHCYAKLIDVTDASAVKEAFGKLTDGQRAAISATGDRQYLCGMYPGKAVYDNLEIKGGAAGGGWYGVETYELDHTSGSAGTVVLAEDKVDWLVGEE